MGIHIYRCVHCDALLDDVHMHERYGKPHCISCYERHSREGLQRLRKELQRPREKAGKALTLDEFTIISTTS